jgi:hypothetical protein
MTAQTWVVGFREAAEDASWWMRWLRHGYAHCWGAKQIDRDLWLWVEWTPAAILFGLAGSAMLDRAMASSHEVLALEVAETAIPPVRPVLALHHCASLVSHTVGIRPRTLATPWWLRCALRRRGARVLIGPEQESPA